MNSILNFLFVFLFIPMAWSQVQRDKLSKHYLVLGFVYFDQNQNGIREANEHGISGVRVYCNDGRSGISQTDGKFTIESDFFGKYIEVTLDEDTVPPGAFFTTTTKEFINEYSGGMRHLEFGLYYEKKHEKFLVDELSPEDKDFFVVPSFYKIEIELKGSDLYLNNSLFVQDFLKNKNEEEKLDPQTINLKVDDVTLAISRKHLKNLEDFVKNSKEKVAEIELNILIPENKTDPKTRQSMFEILQKDFLQNYKNENTEMKIHFNLKGGNWEIVADIKRKKPVNSSACQVEYEFGEKESHPLDFSKVVLAHPVDQDTELEIVCHDQEPLLIKIPKVEIKKAKTGKNYFDDFQKDDNFILDFEILEKAKIYLGKEVFKAHRFIEKNYRLDEKYNFIIYFENGFGIQYPVEISKKRNYKTGFIPSQIVIESSRYISESRSKTVNFRINGEKFRTIEVNGLTYTPETTPQNYLYQWLDRGDQFLRLKIKDDQGRERDYRYDFSLFEDPKMYFEAKWITYNQQNESAFNAVKYNLANIQALDLGVKYFYQERWGVAVQFQKDISDIKIQKLPTGEDRSHNIDMKYLLLRRFWLNDENYHSPKVTLMAGLQRNTFDATTLSTVLVPRNYTALLVGGEFLKERFFNSQIDMNTIMHFSWDINLRSNYNFRLEQQLRWSLNSLGRFFGIDPYYSFYYRYGKFQNLRFVFAPFVDYFDRDIKTQTEGTINSLNYGVKYGVSYFF
ncbi:MAG: hypothetical protein JNM93_09645 [Bacteriovoracaceae bacterium]|nr:hypothetical protein [Bacteriovoracaceae bacterium]